jgi:hypothetical protein
VLATSPADGHWLKDQRGECLLRQSSRRPLVCRRHRRRHLRRAGWPLRWTGAAPGKPVLRNDVLPPQDGPITARSFWRRSFSQNAVPSASRPKKSSASASVNAQRARTTCHSEASAGARRTQSNRANCCHVLLDWTSHKGRNFRSTVASDQDPRDTHPCDQEPAVPPNAVPPGSKSLSPRFMFEAPTVSQCLPTARYPRESGEQIGLLPSASGESEGICLEVTRRGKQRVGLNRGFQRLWDCTPGVAESEMERAWTIQGNRARSAAFNKCVPIGSQANMPMRPRLERPAVLSASAARSPEVRRQERRQLSRVTFGGARLCG